jgi:hypothetical protein
MYYTKIIKLFRLMYDAARSLIVVVKYKYIYTAV